MLYVELPEPRGHSVGCGAWVQGPPVEEDEPGVERTPIDQTLQLVAVEHRCVPRATPPARRHGDRHRIADHAPNLEEDADIAASQAIGHIDIDLVQARGNGTAAPLDGGLLASHIDLQRHIGELGGHGCDFRFIGAHCSQPGAPEGDDILGVGAIGVVQKIVLQIGSLGQARVTGHGQHAGRACHDMDRGRRAGLIVVGDRDRAVPGGRRRGQDGRDEGR